jgi:hypothetical protein
MKRDVLDGTTSSTSLASATNRTIKISASIATTFGSNSGTATPSSYTCQSKNL